MDQPVQKVIDCYDKSAEQYAGQFLNELEGKHLDRLLLKAFAEQNKVPMADFGCGPGQTTRFLYECGATQITGIDISPNMIATAKMAHPHLNFEIGNLLKLDYPAATFKSAVAFYAIVHFSIAQLQLALQEIHRVLDHEGELLFSFHIGSEVIHHNTFLGADVDIEFYFFEVQKVVDAALSTGFKLVDVIERQPYPGVEHPSRRAYIWVRK